MKAEDFKPDYTLLVDSQDIASDQKSFANAFLIASATALFVKAEAGDLQELWLSGYSAPYLLSAEYEQILS